MKKPCDFKFHDRVVLTDWYINGAGEKRREVLRSRTGVIQGLIEQDEGYPLAIILWTEKLNEDDGEVFPVKFVASYFTNCIRRIEP